MTDWPDSPEYALTRLLGLRLGRPPEAAASVDWPAVLRLARQCRAAALVQAAAAGRPDLPHSVRRELLEATQRSFVETAAAAQALSDIASALKDVRWTLLRGPALGARLYGDLALRPFGDLDLLVAREEIDAALAALHQIGYASPPGALDEAYYRRYHLHLELVRPGPPVASRAEVHWALDHPFTLFTINPAHILSRSQPTAIGGLSLPVPEPNDLLLTLAVHLTKHMVRLPTQLQQSRYAEIVTGGFLLQLFDIALALHQFGEQLDWAALAGRAASWGAAGSLRLSLEAVEALWPGLTTAAQREHFRPPAPGWLEQRTQEVLEKLSPSAYGLRKDVFFRPARLLDSLTYIFPPDDFLRRRYRSASAGRRVRHTTTAVLQLAQGGLMLAYYLFIKRLSKRRGGGT